MAGEWGDEDWAGHGWGPNEITATRVHRFLREGPNTRKLVDILDAGDAVNYAVLRDVMSAFNLDDATAEMLDIVGAWVGRPRAGMSDTRFRKAIRAQAISIGSDGGPLTIQSVWSTWVGWPVDWYHTLPAEIVIGGKVAAPDEADLIEFLTDTVPAGVRWTALAYDPANVLLGDYAGDPITAPGTTDYATNPVAGAALTAAIVNP